MRFGLSALLALALTWPASAQAVAIQFILNGGFGTDASPSLASWAFSGDGDANARASTNTINTSGGNAGFNSFFSTAFAVLGDTSGIIDGPPRRETSIISQSFTLPAADGSAAVASWDVVVAFRTAFDGKNATTDSTKWDTFTGALTSVGTLFTQNSGGFPSCGPATACSGTQLTQSYSAPFTLPPGIYTLTFTLDETGDDTANSDAAQLTLTAAGIDSVSVLGTANLVAVPEPATLLLWGVTAIGLGLILRKTARLQ